MTSPVVVGEVAVEISAIAKGFAKSLKREIERELKDLDLSKMVEGALGKKPIRIPVEPVVGDLPEPKTKTRTDQDRTPRTDKPTKTPKVPVELDPLVTAFQAEVRQIAKRLSKQVNVDIPVNAETEELRQNLANAIRRLEQQSSIKVPAGADARRFEIEMRELVERVESTIRLNLDVEVSEAKAAAKAAEAARAAERAAPKVELEVDLDRNLLQRAASTAASALGTVADAGRAAGSAVVSGATAAGNALTLMVNPSTLAAVAAGAIVAALVGIGPAASAAAAGVSLLGGALGSLPALAVGGAATLGVFGLALGGVVDAFKEMGKSAGRGGGAAVNQGRQIAAAQRGIEQASRGLTAALRAETRAQEDLRKAILAVDDARKKAIERIDDLGRSLRGAQLDEQEAQLALADAHNELVRARSSGDAKDIERAEIAYERAQLAVENAKDATEDLTAEKAESDRRGVEGSEEVTAALERQRDAQDRLLSAQDSVKSAQDSLTAANEALAAAQQKVASGGGGVDKFAEAMRKLSPSAQSFVRAVQGMKPAFDDLKRSVQERFFAGLDRTVMQVGQAWIPQLKITLGRYADTFNGFFKDLGKSITTPAFITNIGSAAESVRRLIERVGQAASGPLVDAFGRLAAASAPFIDTLGSELGDLAEDFAAWIKSADESGKLEEFFTTAGDFLSKTFQLGRSVASIFGSIFDIFSQANGQAGGSGILEGTQKFAEFLADPKNQESIAKQVAAFISIGKFIISDVIPPILEFAALSSGLISTIAYVGDSVSGLFDRIGGGVTRFVDGAQKQIGDFPGKVTGFLSGLPDRVGQLFAQLTDRAASVLGLGIGRLVRLFAELPGKAATALSALPGRAADAVSSTGGRIKSVLAALPAQMYNLGRDVVVGLWNGVISMGSWLSDQVRNFTSKVVTWFRIGFDSKSPSRRMRDEVGRWIPPGLAEGITRNLGVVMSARDELVAAATPDMEAEFAARMQPDIGQLAAPAAQLLSTQRIELGWENGSTGDPLLDAIRELIRTRYGGDVVLGLGS